MPSHTSPRATQSLARCSHPALLISNCLKCKMTDFSVCMQLALLQSPFAALALSNIYLFLFCAFLFSQVVSYLYFFFPSYLFPSLQLPLFCMLSWSCYGTTDLRYMWIHLKTHKPPHCCKSVCCKNMQNMAEVKDFCHSFVTGLEKNVLCSSSWWLLRSFMLGRKLISRLNTTHGLDLRNKGEASFK